ncbi:MAG: hypothetical protein ONA90_01980 [candidate division KSB1 bacterium]|nr:hypothetical protein [candidate division KSB1 bacterium]
MLEAHRAQAAGDFGRARTCARRAAGMTMQTAIGIGAGVPKYASTFIEGLRRLANDPSFPDHVRQAAGRLIDRAGKDRRSASQNPVQDAEVILKFFEQKRVTNKVVKG